MQVIQEKKPVKILLPIKPTEIGLTQEVELKGREKDPNCGENIDTLFFSKAYETNMTNIPKFENLNVEKNEVTCKKKKKPKKILAIENEEMKVLVDRNFNKKNQTVYSTTGKSGLQYVHPFLRRNNWRAKNLCLCGNFNMTNIDEVFRFLTAQGQSPRI